MTEFILALGTAVRSSGMGLRRLGGMVAAGWLLTAVPSASAQIHQFRYSGEFADFYGKPQSYSGIITYDLSAPATRLSYPSNFYNFSVSDQQGIFANPSFADVYESEGSRSPDEVKLYMSTDDQFTFALIFRGGIYWLPDRSMVSVGRLATANHFGASYRGTGGATSGTLRIEELAAVPEPATWAMMLVGFGMVAGVARYRRRSVKVSLA